MSKKLLIMFLALFLYAQQSNSEPLGNDINISAKTNKSSLVNSDLNVSDVNTSTETNSSENNETNNTATVDVEDFNASYVSFNSEASFAVVINKQRFFKYVPSLMNALNAYYAQKGIDYNITLYNIDTNISKIKYKNIIYFTTDPGDISKLKDYNKTFYLPLINRNETNITAGNIYYGSIDFKDQVQKLTSFIDDKTDVIADNTLLSDRLLRYEKNLTYIHTVYRFPNIYYRDLNNSFVIFNTSAGKTAQVLSAITQKGIQTKLTLTPQLGYNPLMIILTQPADIQKLLIANSIIHPPLIINEYTSLLNSGIRYNWINYSSCIFANKIYNRQNGEDEFYMSDFNIYIFDNQINYETKLYRIIDGAFKQVE
jgi:hypothetical protein